MKRFGIAEKKGHLIVLAVYVFRVRSIKQVCDGSRIYAYPIKATRDFMKELLVELCESMKKRERISAMIGFRKRFEIRGDWVTGWLESSCGSEHRILLRRRNLRTSVQLYPDFM